MQLESSCEKYIMNSQDNGIKLKSKQENLHQRIIIYRQPHILTETINKIPRTPNTRPKTAPNAEDITPKPNCILISSYRLQTRAPSSFLPSLLPPSYTFTQDRLYTTTAELISLANRRVKQA